MARLLLAASLLLPAWSVPARQADPPPAPADPLAASLAGEFALQDGQLEEAARGYLVAARAANDPVLAERATRIALLAGDDVVDAGGIAGGDPFATAQWPPTPGRTCQCERERPAQATR